MRIDDYFASLERSLRQNPFVSHLQEPFTCLASDDFNGLVRGRAFFWDDSYLDLYEVVSTELGYPVRIGYTYTYLQGGQRVFRYDNAPHHPEIITFPHHKQIGPQDRLAPSDQPSMNQVLAEIAAFTEALDISQRLNNLVDFGITLDLLGSVHERQGQHAAALEKFEQALQLFRQYGSPQQIAVEEQQIARVRTKMGGA